MNYALDALWWRLQTPAVRDLAMLLTAPPPWLSACELPVRTLLGDGGFRYLLALDAEAQPLQQFLAVRQPFAHRLGLYAEALLAFWLSSAPHSRLLAHNLTVTDSNNGQRVGAADFIAELNQQIYHIELACKYYYCGADADSWRGLNPQDTLAGKATKLQQQLALSARIEFQAALNALGASQSITSVSVLRGMLFTPPQPWPEQAPINPYAWRGVCGLDWVDLLATVDTTTCRFAPLARMDCLAPRRLPESDTVGMAEIQTVAQGMVAVLQARADGCWHEILRLMKVQAA